MTDECRLMNTAPSPSPENTGTGAALSGDPPLALAVMPNGWIPQTLLVARKCCHLCLDLWREFGGANNCTKPYIILPWSFSSEPPKAPQLERLFMLTSYLEIKDCNLALTQMSRHNETHCGGNWIPYCQRPILFIITSHSHPANIDGSYV